MLQWLIDTIPNVLEVFIQSVFDPVHLVFLGIEVSQDKKELFVKLLFE